MSIVSINKKNKFSLNTLTIFKNQQEINLFMSNFPHFKKSFEGSRTITFICTSSNLKPNSPALQKNKNIKRNCTSSIFFGFLKEKNLWYTKRFNPHGKFCRHKPENDLSFNFEKIQKIAEQKILIKKEKKEEIDFFSVFISDFRRIGNILNSKVNSFRYENVHKNLIENLKKRNFVGFFRIKNYHFFVCKKIEANFSLSLLENFKEEIKLEKKEDVFNLKEVFLVEEQEKERLVLFFYEFYAKIEENEFSLVFEDLMQTFSFEYNFLNKNNKTISEKIDFEDKKEGEIEKNILGINFLFDVSNCRRNIFEVQIYERNSRDIFDIQNSCISDYKKFTIKIFSFNGADRKELIALSIFEYHENQEMNLQEIFENFISFFLHKISGIKKSSNLENYAEVLSKISFIIPFNVFLIELFLKSKIDFFINTRTLTEYLLILNEFQLQKEILEKSNEKEKDFQNSLYSLRQFIGNLYDNLNTKIKEKENINELSDIKKLILHEISKYETNPIIYQININNLFISEFRYKEKIKQLYGLNNFMIKSYEDFLIEKIKNLNFEIMDIKNPIYEFSTFFDIQWSILLKNEEIKNEKERIISFNDLRKLKKNETMKISDLNYEKTMKNDFLEIKINTELTFILKNLKESFKNVPYFLSRNVYKKLNRNIEKAEILKDSCFSIILKEKDFRDNNILESALIEEGCKKIKLIFNPKKDNLKEFHLYFYKDSLNKIQYDCSCKEFNKEFIPCFHLILLLSLFNQTDSNTLVYDFLSPIYGLIKKKEFVQIVGEGKYDSQKLGRPRK